VKRERKERKERKTNEGERKSKKKGNRRNKKKKQKIKNFDSRCRLSELMPLLWFRPPKLLPQMTQRRLDNRKTHSLMLSQPRVLALGRRFIFVIEC